LLGLPGPGHSNLSQLSLEANLGATAHRPYVDRAAMKRRQTYYVALAAAAALSTRTEAAPADEPAEVPPPAVQVIEPAPAHASSEPSVEPVIRHPPWTGREAIWGGVALAVAGAATLIIALPVACYAGRSSDVSATCVDAVVGGGAGGLGLGGILLIVGESQQATYKQWLKTHPMFSGLRAAPMVGGVGIGWSSFF
jgi:hypothetical protein